MKFKATISRQGLRLLEKRFIATFEKFGKNCKLLLSPEDACFVQDEHDSDGLVITSRLANKVLFEPNTCVCSSRHGNLIAFTFEIPLFLKVLKSAAAHQAEALDMRLTLRNVPNAAGTGEVAKRPVLAFSWRGHDITITQDMPISKPFSETAVDEIKHLSSHNELCNFYVDIVPQATRLQKSIDKLKSISSDVLLSTTKQGDLHLNVSSAGVVLGEAITALDVRPDSAFQDASELKAVSAEGRLREARENDEASSACVAMKHIGRALHSCLLSVPDMLLLGIADGSNFVHMIFAYRETHNPDEFTEEMSLQFKIPVKEEL